MIECVRSHVTRMWKASNRAFNSCITSPELNHSGCKGFLNRTVTGFYSVNKENEISLTQKKLKGASFIPCKFNRAKSQKPLNRIQPDCTYNLTAILLYIWVNWKPCLEWYQSMYSEAFGSSMNEEKIKYLWKNWTKSFEKIVWSLIATWIKSSAQLISSELYKWMMFNVKVLTEKILAFPGPELVTLTEINYVNNKTRFVFSNNLRKHLRRVLDEPFMIALNHARTYLEDESFLMPWRPTRIEINIFRKVCLAFASWCPKTQLFQLSFSRHSRLHRGTSNLRASQSFR